MAVTKPSGIEEVCTHFQILGDFKDAQRYGNGHINDTYVVTYNQSGRDIRYLLQRINHQIFKSPPALMGNIERATRHIRQKLEFLKEGDLSRKTLTLIPALDGQYYFQDIDANYWRIYLFVEGARTYDTVESTSQAFEVGRAFGKFQLLLSDLPADLFHVTIPDFHHTPKRFENLLKAIEEDRANRARGVRQEIDFALKRQSIVGKLVDLHSAGKIPERVVHNDTKLNNVMLDNATGEGICVIDLDTLMPGLSLYDFGDMVRTSTNAGAEDETDLSKVYFKTDFFESLARGYLEAADTLLNPVEKSLLPFSGKLITFEIGLRFLTDYLNGDVYFKIKRPEHNRDRSRTQFKLVSCIEEKEEDLCRLVEGLS